MNTVSAPDPVPEAFAALDPATDSELCDVCGAPPPLQRDLAVSLMGVVDAWVCRCETCGFRQVRPRLDTDEIRRLYPDDYFDSGGRIGFGDYARQQQRYEREAFFLARRLARIAPAGRLLEVGCALGFLLDALRSRSAWESAGLDISTFATHFACTRYGLDVRSATLEEAGFPDSSFDFVIQKDLLEHVGRPREHLQETRRILRRGGHVLIVTPNGEANLRPLRRLSRELRAGGDATRLPLVDQGHLSFFSRSHLLRLLSDSGLEPVRFRSIRVRRGLRALGWLPSRRRRHHAVAAGHGRPVRAGNDTVPGTAHDHSPAAAGPAPPVGDRGAAGGEAGTESLAARMAMELEAHRKPVRSWPVYFYMRQIMERLDTLPARFPLGNDFEILARRS